MTKSIYTLLLLLVLVPFGGAERIYYSFWDGTDGGVARMVLNEAGQIIEQETLFAEPESDRATMLDATMSGEWLVLINERDEDHTVISLAPNQRPIRLLKIYPDDRPELIRTMGEYAIVTGNTGKIHTINPRRPSVVRMWDGRQDIDPPIYRPDDIVVLPEENAALVAFRQDFRGGNRLGNRIVVLDMARLTVQGDLHLPRDHEDLHYPEGSQDVGPNPHRLFVWPERNLLAVLLENYGAVTFADLNAALEGEWKEHATLPTSSSGEWGVSFPHSGTFFEVGGRPFFIIGNASEEGGCAIFDLDAMEMVQYLHTGRLGVRDPVWFPGYNRLVTTRWGLKKFRGEEGIDFEYDDFHDVLTIDVAPLAAGGEAVWSQSSFDEIIYDLAPVDPEASDFVVLYAMGDRPLIMIWNAAHNELVDVAESRGLIRTVVPAKY